MNYKKSWVILLLSLGLIFCNSWAEMGTSFATSRPSLEKSSLENLNLRQRSEGKKSQDLPEVPKTPSLHLFKNPDLLIQKESLKNQKKIEGGEWGSSGGGSGVACFKNPSLAQEAQSFVTQNLPLPIHIVEKIETVETLDYWEVKNNLTSQLQHLSQNTPEEILGKTYFNLTRLVPLFVFRLEQASQLIEFSKWEPTLKLPKIPDLQLKKELPVNCILVQLAVRWTQEKDFSPDKPFRSLPRVKVQFNPLLYDKLDNINKANLKLHEQLYLLSQLNGHSSSDTIRPLSVMFLTENLRGMSISGNFQRSLRDHLFKIFGDYIHYFGDALLFSAKSPSPESRYNSLYKYVSTIFSQVEECKNSPWPEDKKVAWRPDRKEHDCLDFVNDPVYLGSWMTAEMAFLYISISLIDVSLAEMNSEYLVTPFVTAPLIELSQKKLNFACQKILEMQMTDPMYDQLLHKAQSYCKDINLHRSAKEINQN